MTIASAFNDIAVAQGGTAAKSGAITAAIDALNDALAGSDQPKAQTIEQAVRLLGEHIGGGGSSTVKCYILNINDMTTAYLPTDVTVQDSNRAPVTVESDQVTSPDGPVDCISFTADSGGQYFIGSGDRTVDSGSIVLLSSMENELPSSALTGGFIFVAPNSPFVAMIETTR